MKNVLLILLLFSLIGLKCNKNSGSYNICADTNEARMNISLYDAVTRQDYFGKIGTNKILPEEINMYEEGFKPFLLGKTIYSAGYPWNGRYISAGYVSNAIQIPYVEDFGHTRDSVGKDITRIYYLKIKRDVDTIKINYFMDNYCNKQNKYLKLYYNDSLYYTGNPRNYEQVNIYKK